MGFYFRKSFGSGPFRINISKSGISYSAGIKGARVNFGNRGTYVNFGSHGIYYRKKISDFGQKKYSRNQTNFTPVTYEQHTITSSNIEKITDTDSQDFINELTEKGKKISYYNWLGIFPLVLSAIILLYAFFSTDNSTINHPVSETKDFIKSLSTSNTNVRQNPSKTSKILGIINSDEQFELVDENQPDWYKINFNGQNGFVSKKFTEKTTAAITNEESTTTSNPNLFARQPSLFWTLFVLLGVFFSILLSYLRKVDNKRLLVEIYYDIDDNIKDVYEKFVYHFSPLLHCSRAWQYLHSERTYDYKYSSGAAHTVTRKPLLRISTNKTPSRIFKTNVEIPYLGLINTELYFFPERLIIKRGDEFGAIMYKNIECFGGVIQFIESGGVPNDSIVVGQTWRYLNKNGTPDRRFNNNYRIPICQYSEYSFKSESGLNEKISTSKVGAFDEFIRYIKAIGQLQKHIPDTQYNNPNPRKLQG